MTEDMEQAAPGVLHLTRRRMWPRLESPYTKNGDVRSTLRTHCDSGWRCVTYTDAKRVACPWNALDRDSFLWLMWNERTGLSHMLRMLRLQARRQNEGELSSAAHPNVGEIYSPPSLTASWQIQVFQQETQIKRPV